MSRSTKRILTEAEIQQEIEKAANEVYTVAAAAYGAKGGNVILSNYGDPTVSRDGITNVRRVELPNRAQHDAARIIVQASAKTNETQGDGTTLAVILTKHLLDAGRRLVGSGVYDRMTAARKLEAIVGPIHRRLEEIAIRYDSDNLRQVAAISAGDSALGALIADSFEAVGLDGGITVERHPGLGVYPKIEDGFYWNRGFTNLWLTNDSARLRAEHNEANIFIVDKQITGAHEMGHILDACGNNGIKRLVIVGEVNGQAMDVLIGTHTRGMFDIALVSPPNFAGNRTMFLEDLAKVTGGRVYTNGMSADSFDVDMLGHAQRVSIGEFDTIVTNGTGPKEDVLAHIERIKDDLKKNADSPRTVEAIQERLSRLTGKICIIRVGGATPADADHMKLKVDDAVCAVRAAMKSGVLPGGGVALLACQEVAGDFGEALAQPFKLLMANGGRNAEKSLAALADKPIGYGFDLNEESDEPTDLTKAGVLDALDVIKEAVTNAATTAARLTETKAAVVDNEDNGPDYGSTLSD